MVRDGEQGCNGVATILCYILGLTHSGSEPFTLVQGCYSYNVGCSQLMGYGVYLYSNLKNIPKGNELKWLLKKGVGLFLRVFLSKISPPQMQLVQLYTCTCKHAPYSIVPLFRLQYCCEVIL